VGPLGGEGGGRDIYIERERRYVGGSRGRWACCFDGIPSKQAVFLRLFVVNIICTSMFRK